MMMISSSSSSVCWWVLIFAATILLIVSGDNNHSYKKYKKSIEDNHIHSDKDRSSNKVRRSDSNKPPPMSNEVPVETYDPEFRKLIRPFRMAKINVIWSKAQQTLTEPKLKSLFTDLKLQDKQEMDWKQSTVDEAPDKSGQRAAAMRNRLARILNTYGLLERFAEEIRPNDANKYKKYDRDFWRAVDGDEEVQLFKDKRLNELWQKIDRSGFTGEELQALREEFDHHQQKVALYYNLLDDAGKYEAPLIDGAAAAATDEGRISYDHELGREQNLSIREDFDRIERKVAQGPNNSDFIEPSVRDLWNVANSGKIDFSKDDLQSLRVELMHYESRLLKLRHLNAELAMFHDRERKKEFSHLKDGKHPTLEQHVKKQTRKVEKMQESLEKRIYQHSEL